jgi:Family of unknown function (DUF5343)
MADAAKKSFPRLPVSTWWNLRKKFKQSIPGVVTDNYLATVLDIKVDSARANVLPFLKQLGIIDEDGKTGDRAKFWRDDEHYPAVCKQILQEVYPEELLQAVPGPPVQRARAERWFAHETGTGTGAAGQMATLYTVLVEADATKQADGEKKERAAKSSDDKPRRAVRTIQAATTVPSRTRESEPNGGTRKERQVPGININLQVHISADATADQIDQIFASMAKHIYPRD